MSEHAQTPGAGGEDRALPNGGGGGGGPGPGPGPNLVFVRFSTAATTPMFVGVPFAVQGIAGSIPPTEVTSVSLTVDGAAVPVVNDGGDWGNWHAVVTPVTTG